MIQKLLYERSLNELIGTGPCFPISDRPEIMYSVLRGGSYRNFHTIYYCEMNYVGTI